MPHVIQLDNSSIRMKVIENFQQPKLYIGNNSTNVPPLPSFKADSYQGSDRGFVEKFSVGVHDISPHNYNYGAGGWDGSDSRVISNSYPPIVGSLLSYNQGSVINYNRFTHEFYFPGITPSTSSFMRLDSGTTLAHLVNPLNPSLLSNQLLPFAGGISNYRNAREPQIESYMEPHDLSKTIGKHDVCGTSPEDLADYSKSLTKFIICEPILEGDQIERFHNEIDGDGILQVVSDDPVNFLVLRPRALWSMEENYAPVQTEEGQDNQENVCDCHVYPKKHQLNSTTGLPELVDDDCYLPVEPAYFDGAEIHVERLIDPVIVSTNPEIVQWVKNNKCFDNIINIEVDGETFEYVVADFIDTNIDARKRGGAGGGSGVPNGYDPECIVICDKDGNEKEGYILFKEEDCDAEPQEQVDEEPETSNGIYCASCSSQSNSWWIQPSVDPSSLSNYDIVLANCGADYLGNPATSYSVGYIDPSSGLCTIGSLGCEACGEGSWYPAYASIEECRDDHCNAGIDNSCCGEF